jgi:hypothetical protein
MMNGSEGKISNDSPATSQIFDFKLRQLLNNLQSAHYLPHLQNTNKIDLSGKKFFDTDEGV